PHPVRARRLRSHRSGRCAAPCARRDRGDENRARGTGVRAGQRAHRARVAGGPRPPPAPRAGPGPGGARSRPASAHPPRPAARAGYSDAARAVLVQANGQVNQQGAIADYLDVERGYERAVEACLGDLLQHVVVERAEHAAAGFQLVRAAGAGRCGFLITSALDARGAAGTPDTAMSAAGDVPFIESPAATPRPLPDGVIALSSVVHVNGPFAPAIRQAIGDAAIAPSYEAAANASRLTALPVVTGDGDVFRGPYLVSGGGQAESRGILETKREIKELRDRIA